MYEMVNIFIHFTMFNKIYLHFGNCYHYHFTLSARWRDMDKKLDLTTSIKSHQNYRLWYVYFVWIWTQ